MATDALKEQNHWILANYAVQHKLIKHPDFAWAPEYLKDKQVIANLANIKAMASKSHHGQKYRFGVQIPMDTSLSLIHI